MSASVYSDPTDRPADLRDPNAVPPHPEHSETADARPAAAPRHPLLDDPEALLPANASEADHIVARIERAQRSLSANVTELVDRVDPVARVQQVKRIAKRAAIGAAVAVTTLLVIRRLRRR
jgi:hypothetical protein